MRNICSRYCIVCKEHIYFVGYTNSVISPRQGFKLLSNSGELNNENDYVDIQSELFFQNLK